MATTRGADSFAGVLRRQRVGAGLSQEALAELAGISARGLSDLERGRSRAPRLDTLSRLASALGLDADGRHALIQASGHLSDGDSPERAELPTTPGTSTFTAQNLPVNLTGLVGRERDEAAVAALLSEPTIRLLTLTGPGGVGKTRLAVQVAAHLADVCPDGVVFVGLAAVSDPTLVLATVAQALGIGDRGELPLLESVLLALRKQQLLLVLDNYEHVLDAAPLVVDLLVGSSNLRILVTSRTLLRVGGEHVFTVSPLALPAAVETIGQPVAALGPAVELFLLRAQAVQPSFVLTEDNVESIVGVCRELDGLPLALELAAARVNVLQPATLLARLRDRLSLLTSGRRDAPERHRALRDAIAWSYDLLSADEQRLFRWLGVFAGGWTLQSAEAVCGQLAGELPVLDGLAALVEHSLVQAQVGGDSADASRFRLLETIREHALERLAASDDAAAARGQHAAAFLALAEVAEPYVARPRAVATPLDVELDNIRAVLAWSLTPEGDPDIGQRLVGSLAWFWYLRGRLHEGRRWAEQLLSSDVSTAPTPGRARALFSMGGFSLMLGDTATVRPYLEECVALYRAAADWRLPQGLTLLGIAQASLGEPGAALKAYDESVAFGRIAGDAWLEAYTLTNQGAAMARVGDVMAAEGLQHASLALFSRLDDPWGRGIALRGLAGLALARADYATALTLYEQAVPIFRQTRELRGLAQTLLGLGKAAMRERSATYAGAAFTEALTCWQELGIWAGVVRSVSGLAWVAAAQGRFEQAARLYGAADAHAQVLGVMFVTAELEAIDRTLVDLRARLEHDGFATAWACGEGMTLEQAAADALHPEASAGLLG